MKRAVMTALAVSLLSGTSALAQNADSPVVRLAREMAARAEGQRAAPPPRETRPQQAQAPQVVQPSQSRGGGSGSENRGRPSTAEAPRARETPRETQGQRPTNLWQAQSRPDNQAAASRAPRVDQGQRQQGQRQDRPREDTQAGRGPGRPDGQANAGRPDNRPGQQSDRNRTNPPVVGVARDLAREIVEEQRADDRRRRDSDRYRDRDWENDRYRDRNWDDDRDWQGRRPVIRPEDRRDRDRNRPRYEERRYPRYVTSQQRYRWRGPVWRAPVGYYSFRWQWGQTLPWNWYTPNYYLNDYWAYGLPMPPIGCEWVRVGDDAILVDVFNGRVYQVVYNLFW